MKLLEFMFGLITFVFIFICIPASIVYLGANGHLINASLLSILYSLLICILGFSAGKDSDDE